MLEIWKKQQWSKGDAFILPLTGLSRNDKYNLKSYLFWNENSIFDFKLTITVDNIEGASEYCKKTLIPVLDKFGYLLECYENAERIIYVLDISEWAMDIHMFTIGKYSRFSNDAKKLIETYHFYEKRKVPLDIAAFLYPNRIMELLDKQTPIEYCAFNYNLDLDELRKVGEVGSLYDKFTETLLTDITTICNNDIKINEV